MSLSSSQSTWRLPDARGFLLRALALGPLLAVCALRRDGILLALPGLLLAMVLGARRIVVAPAAAVCGPRWRRGLGLVLLGLAAAGLPYALIRPPTHHEIWTGVWEGLGDFDRTKGHVWSDSLAVKLVTDAGFDHGVPPEVEMFDRELSSPEKEAFFRRRVLDVRSDPLWYLANLGKRVVATVTQDELFVLGGRSTPSEQARRGPHATIPTNQGRIRFFYHLVPTADSIGLGPWRRAVPLGVLWALGAAFVYAAARDRKGRGLRPALSVAGCLVGAALPLPVLITTAGALETEAFVLVYILAFAFVVEWIWWKGREAWRRSALS